MTGILATTAVNPEGNNGLFYGNPSLLGVQVVAVLATMAFSAGVTYGLLKLLDATIGLRNDEEQEDEGLDLVEHGERGYTELI